MKTRRQEAIEDLKNLVSIYERFRPSKVFYDKSRDAFRYIGVAYDYTSGK